jgi:Tfp pilus assembly protein PilE
MGQQQLLLVILVTIVVGIATLVAINIFGSSAKQSNHDAVHQDLAQIGVSAQGWYIKPAALGGGGGSFSGISFSSVDFPGEITNTETALEATNLNGTYRIVPGTANEFTVEGRPSSNGTEENSIFVATISRNDVSISVSVESGNDPAPNPGPPIRPTRPNRPNQ